MNRVEDVFGVNKNLTTYLERENVDGKMKSALSEKKHVVIYGSSKQGKTLLLDRMNIENKIIVNIGDSTKTIDIYKSIIRQLELKIMGKIVSSTGSGTTAKAEASLSAKVPFLGKASAGIDGGIEYKESQEIESSYVGYDFNQAQSIVEMIRKQKKHKIIIDDFHYLNLEEQKKLAKDLKVFYENEIQFIILGVWKEKNWLLQHNPELSDRLELIPVEPWTAENFEEIIKRGSNDLGVKFKKEVVSKIIENSFDNVGILQEICKKCCLKSKERNDGIITLEDFEWSLAEKKSDYSTQYVAILNKIATYSTKGVLFLPYYLMRVILDIDIVRLKSGLTKKFLHYQIQQRHYDKREEKVRLSDMTNFLNNTIIQMQSNLDIKPLIFDYNLESEVFSIIDSRLIFYIANTDLKKMIASIEVPEELDEILADERINSDELVLIPVSDQNNYEMFLKSLSRFDNDESKIEFLNLSKRS